jgi:hypothetical protein
MSEVTTGITMEQLQAILAHQAEQNRAAVTEAIRAAKEPSAEEAEKRTELQRRAAISRKQSHEQMQAEENAKKQRHANCGNYHKKENGKWATSGQVIGGRYCILICQHCQKTWYKTFDREVTAQLLAGDLTLFQASPEGWSEEMPWPTVRPEEAVAVA